MKNNLSFEIEFNGVRPTYIIAKVLRLGLFAGLLGIGTFWVWDNYSITIFQQQSLPILKASHMPMKIKPKNPGGMEFPYRDLGVYCRISEC